MALSMSPRRVSYVRISVGLLAVLASAPLAASAAQYGGGNGTPENPFLISTPEEFAMIGANPADWNMHFKLVADIDLSAYDETNLHLIGHWVMLGSTANQPFNGSFEGNGKTISGFHYKDMQSEYVGLFQHVTGEIRNLKLARPAVIGDGIGTGSLVGYLEKGAVSTCSAIEANVSGNEAVGALVGAAGGNVYTSWSNGTVSGVRYVGGLIGQAGGGIIARSYSKAAVVGNESVGGFLGGMLKETGIVESCYAAGPVDGALYVGGLVGQVVAGSVWRSYSVGLVTGKQSAGGLIGYQRALAAVYVSFWDMETSKQATSIGGAGKTTIEMKTLDTYLSMNWDFWATWTMCEGVSYPILFWQIPVGDLRCPDGVNFTDFIWFAANWRHSNCGELNHGCEGADLDGSGEVDLRDLSLFAANWMAGVDWD